MNRKTNQATHPTGNDGNEQRRSHRLRSLFDTAFAMVEPFLDARNGWAGSSLEHLAFRVVRGNFPELTSAEVQVLVAAVQRAYIDRYPDNSEHLPHSGELGGAPA